MKKDLKRAKNYIYRLISIRPRSEHEIRAKLREKGYGEPVADEAILFFKGNGIIDDLKFARMWVDSRMRSRPRGDIVLSYELKKKGVSEEAVKKALAEARADAGKDEEDEVRAMVRELKEKNKSLSPLKLKKKLYDHLARRGFRYGVIKDMLEEVLGAE